MYSRFQLARKYLHYYLTAANGKGHGIHSPFVFEFITRVLKDRTVYPEYKTVEGLRGRLLRDKSLLHVEDLGAGSIVSTARTRTVASIAKHAAKPARYGQLLYRMVKYYQPGVIIEVGTSLGITSAYLSVANPGARVITLEGASEVLTVARKNFMELQLHNIETCEGNFDKTLHPLLDALAVVDFCFIDGNHRLGPTIQYFEAVLPKTHNLSFLVLDDIHWSREMEEAWQYCRDHPSVTLSIDLFFIGILIFRKEIREKQHFSIRF